jgi:hypothetical protein
MGQTAPHRTQHLDAAVRVRGTDFTFHLLTRPLGLGPGLTARYYWMDSSGFRVARGRRGCDPANFRNCVGHWWAAMRSLGLGDDPDQVRHLLLATSYALISRGNALQRVYRDAHLRPGATDPTGRSLPDPVRDRIRQAVLARDPRPVREVLDELLGWHRPTDDQAALTARVLDGVLGHGVDLVHRRGGDGLHEFLGRVDEWFLVRMKKGGGGLLRPFLRRFAYECKVAFHRCYANAWVDLIPWLQEHRGLDRLSERFLRFWHVQTQPAERPDGTVEPDAFRGHVLALHPLSGFFMKDPALMSVAGRFFGTDAYDRAFARGQAATCGEYWDLVGAVLTAAALYRQALDEQDDRRGVRVRAAGDLGRAAAPAEGRPATGLIEEFAEHLGLRCPGCHGGLSAAEPDPSDLTPEGLTVALTCRRCGAGSRHVLDPDDLDRWLLRQA